jgi:HAD superfamily hydrolase (TIGR01490 family)
MNILNKKVAFIDLDGTLTAGQVQFELLKYFFSRGLVSHIFYFRLLLWFLLYKIPFLDLRPEKAFRYAVLFLRDKSVDLIDSEIDAFVKKYIIDNILPGAINLIDQLRVDGFEIVILSTAIDPVISKLSKSFAISDYICTRLSINDGKYVGTVSGSVVYGSEKLNQINQYCQLHAVDIKNCVAYADHESDIEMLRSVGKGYLVNPDSHLLKLAAMYSLNIHYTSR